MDLSGKKAVVFGGTSGIGLATTLLLAEDGAEVTAISREPKKAGTLPSGITTRACDVLDRGAVEAILQELSPIDILVTAATGGRRAFGPFLEMDLDGYKASFDKLWGYANVVRYGAAHVNDGGSITLVSGAPARNCLPGQVALSSVALQDAQGCAKDEERVYSRRHETVARGLRGIVNILNVKRFRLQEDADQHLEDWL